MGQKAGSKEWVVQVVLSLVFMGGFMLFVWWPHIKEVNCREVLVSASLESDFDIRMKMVEEAKFIAPWWYYPDFYEGIFLFEKEEFEGAVASLERAVSKGAEIEDWVYRLKVLLRQEGNNKKDLKGIVMHLDQVASKMVPKGLFSIWLFAVFLPAGIFLFFALELPERLKSKNTPSWLFLIVMTLFMGGCFKFSKFMLNSAPSGFSKVVLFFINLSYVYLLSDFFGSVSENKQEKKVTEGWVCPKCETKLTKDHIQCWSCGYAPEGEED